MVLSSKLLVRWLPLLLLLMILILCVYFQLYTYLSFSSLAKYRVLLLNWQAQHYFQSIIIFILVYTLCIACSLPGTLFMNLLSGFLFGYIGGTLYVVIGATMGGTILFLAVRSSLGHALVNSVGIARFKKLKQGFKEDAFNYLLILRLVPIAPFFVVNIAAGLFRMPLKSFVIATFFGIIPCSFIYVFIGHSFGHIWDTGSVSYYSIIFTPAVLIPLSALALLCLAPVLYRYWKRRSLKNEVLPES